MTKQPETLIVNAVCDYLSLRMKQGKLMFWRQNTSPIFNAAAGAYRAMPKYSMNGVPDILIIKDGDFIGLEIKTKKGRQSDNQKEFERLCKLNAGEYYIVTDVSQLQEIGL